MQFKIVFVILFFVSSSTFAAKAKDARTSDGAQNYVQGQIQIITKSKDWDVILPALKNLRNTIDQSTKDLSAEGDKLYQTLSELKSSQASEQDIQKAQDAYLKSDNAFNSWSSYKIAFKKIFTVFIDKDTTVTDCSNLNDKIKLFYLGNSTKPESTFPAQIRQALELSNHLCKINPK